jgi:hypothetical protein
LNHSLQDAAYNEYVAATAPELDPEEAVTFFHVMALAQDWPMMEAELSAQDDYALKRRGAYVEEHKQAYGRLVAHIVAWNRLPGPREPHYDLSRRVVESIVSRSRYHLEVRDNGLQTPLMIAAGAGNDEMCRVLMRYGASVLKSSNSIRLQSLIVLVCLALGV